MPYLLLLLLLLISPISHGDDLTVTDSEGNEITIQSLPAEGELLVIWFVDHAEPREDFDNLLASINQLGIEVWRVDLLAAYFLPRSSETVRTLPGNGVASVIQAAHRLRDKHILLASYDRMPLPLLRGVRQWQLQTQESRLLGAMLFYPNLFIPPAMAGEEPQIDPILQATNIPLVIYQPALGSQRWRLAQALQPLWQAGSPTYAYLVPDVRDWFFMGEDDHGPRAPLATQTLPGQIRRFSELLAQYPPVTTARPLAREKPARGQIRTLVELSQPWPAKPFKLEAIDRVVHDSGDLQGRVVLLNFWATWCPPCVEELPSLNRLQQRYAGRDLRIVSVDFRETPSQMAEFLQRTPVEFPILMDRDGKLALDWGVFSFPSSFIIDRQGAVRYSANRAIDWDSPEVWQALDRLLDED